MEKVIYLDNNATTKTAEEVFEAIKPFFTEYYGNPSSIHTFGGSVSKNIQRAREQVAEFLGASPEEIIFTSCGTESDNTAILSALNFCPTRNKIVTSTVEHPAVLNLCKTLEKKGYKVVYIPVDNKGRLDMEFLDEQVDRHTAVVSIMYANNETGTIFPLEKIAEIAKERGAIMHTDAVQAVGKIPINLKKSKIDFLSLSGHKIHAPKGIGALYIRKGIKFSPIIIGGHQEFGRRGGTENVPGIIALGKACELAAANIDKENTFVKELRDRLEQELTKIIPDTRINGDMSHRLPNTTSISFEYIEGEAILLMLDRYGICASSGSACTTGSLEPSHVLRAMGLPYTAAHGTIRFSLSRYNTYEEIDRVIEVLPDIVKKLRIISPYYQ